LGGKQVARTRKNKRAATGLSPGMNCLPHFTIALRRRLLLRRIGRQAPVKRCLARIAQLSLHIFFAGHLLPCPLLQRKSLSVRQHLLDAGYVGFVDERELLELTHAARGFGAHQMALPRMAALDFAGGGEPKALACAAVRFQFQFWFRSISRHFLKSSPI
jgi:hypothetical protein